MAVACILMRQNLSEFYKSKITERIEMRNSSGKVLTLGQCLNRMRGLHNKLYINENQNNNFAIYTYLFTN